MGTWCYVTLTHITHIDECVPIVKKSLIWTWWKNIAIPQNPKKIWTPLIQLSCGWPKNGATK